MREAVEGEARVRVLRVGEVDRLDECGLIVIGSPIYYERPLKSILEFLEKRRDELRDREVAVFIVCIANLFSRLAGGIVERVEEYYIRQITGRIPGRIVKTGVIKGWLLKPDPKQKIRAQKWIREVLAVSSHNMGQER